MEFVELLSQRFDVNFLLNSMLVLTLIGSVSILFLKIKQNQKIKKLYTIHSGTITKKETTQSFIYKFGDFRLLKESISYLYFFDLKKKKKEKRLFLILVVIEFIAIITGVIFDKVAIALLVTVVGHYIAIGTIKISSKDIDDIVSSELPMIIKHFVKTLSKTSDLKVVIYQTSKHVEMPLKTKFEMLARRMLSEDDEKCLNEFADEINSIWMYTFIFLINSLKEYSKKADVIENLKLLSRILEENNLTKAKELAENRPAIMMNYAIALLAVVGLVANLMFNEVGRDFLLNTMNGMFVFSAGVGAILGTFLLNTVLSKTTKGGL